MHVNIIQGEPFFSDILLLPLFTNNVIITQHTQQVFQLGYKEEQLESTHNKTKGLFDTVNKRRVYNGYER